MAIFALVIALLSPFVHRNVVNRVESLVGTISMSPTGYDPVGANQRSTVPQMHGHSHFNSR